MVQKRLGTAALNKVSYRTTQLGYKKHSDPVLALLDLPGPCKPSERLLSTAHQEATPGLLLKWWSSALRCVLVLPSSPTGSGGQGGPPVHGWTAGEKRNGCELLMSLRLLCFTEL